MMTEEESDFGGNGGDVDQTTDQEKDIHCSSTDELDKKKKFRKKKKKVTIQDKLGSKNSLSDEESPPPIRAAQGANAFHNLWKRSRGLGLSDDEDSQPGCFQTRAPGKRFTTEEYQIETTIHINKLKGDIVFTGPPPGETTPDGAAAPANVVYNIHLPNLDAALIEALKATPGNQEIFNQIFSSLPQSVRASKRKKTTKSKESPNSDIQKDFCNVESGLGNQIDIEEDEGCGASLENEDIICSNGDEFKDLINSLKENSNTSQLTAEVHESSDGQISITWKVLVKKITEHQDGYLGWAIPKVVIVIALSAFAIISAILLLHYFGVLKGAL